MKVEIKGTHTPTPWWGIKEIEDLETRIRIQPYTGQNVYVKGPNAPANAAYILKCVNSHEDLIKALKEKRRIIEDTYSLYMPTDIVKSMLDVLIKGVSND